MSARARIGSTNDFCKIDNGEYRGYELHLLESRKRPLYYLESSTERPLFCEKDLVEVLWDEVLKVTGSLNSVTYER